MIQSMGVKMWTYLRCELLQKHVFYTIKYRSPLQFVYVDRRTFHEISYWRNFCRWGSGKMNMVVTGSLMKPCKYSSLFLHFRERATNVAFLSWPYVSTCCGPTNDQACDFPGSMPLSDVNLKYGSEDYWNHSLISVC